MAVKLVIVVLLGRRLAFSVAVMALLLLLLTTGVITPNARPY